MQTVTVREGRPGDDIELVSVKQAAIAAADEAYTPRELDAWMPGVAELGDYGSAIESDRYLVLVAETGGETAGYGILDVERGALLALYVDPAKRDSGIGSTLLGQIETSAQFQGAQTLELLASQNAIGFYEGLGYEKSAVIERELEGETLAFVKMTKSLSG